MTNRIKNNSTITVLNYILLLGIFVMVLTYFNGVVFNLLLWSFVPAGAIICFIVHRSLFVNSYLKYLFLLFLWSGFTHIFAIDPELSWTSMIRMLGVFGFCTILGHLSTYRNCFNWLNLIYIIFLLICLIYARTNILHDNIELDSDERLNSQNLNANFFAYLSFFACISVFYFGNCFENKYLTFINKIFFILFIPLSFYITILTASRQFLIILLPLIAVLLWRRYLKRSALITKIASIIIFCFAFLYCADYVEDVYNNSLLKERNEKIEDDTRIFLIDKAIEVGFENPIVGVGPNNFLKFGNGQFSHNSFTELFANSGIIAVLIYIFILLYFLKNQILLYKKYKQSRFVLFLIFGIFYIIANNFYVYYTNIWLMGYFIMIASNGLNSYADSENTNEKMIMKKRQPRQKYKSSDFMVM